MTTRDFRFNRYPEFCYRSTKILPFEFIDFETWIFLLERALERRSPRFERESPASAFRCFVSSTFSKPLLHTGTRGAVHALRATERVDPRAPHVTETFRASRERHRKHHGAGGARARTPTPVDALFSPPARGSRVTLSLTRTLPPRRHASLRPRRSCGSRKRNSGRSTAT